jgi:hypothetical protein
MIQNPEQLKKLEDRFIRDEGKLSFSYAIRLFTSMWDEGVSLGIFPPKEPLEGIDVDIRIAKVLNSCSRKSFPV